jgi:hypothetical protein
VVRCVVPLAAVVLARAVVCDCECLAIPEGSFPSVVPRTMLIIG